MNILRLILWIFFGGGLILLTAVNIACRLSKWRNRPNTYKFKSEISNKTFRNYQGSTNGYVK